MELDPDFKIGSQIWQGDLLGFGDWDHSEPLNKYGVIITADCDIQRARPEQELVYLRVVTQPDYVDTIWSRSKLELARQKALNDLMQMINRHRLQSDPKAIALGMMEVEKWITSVAPSEICDAIAVVEERDRDRLNENIARATASLQDCQIPPDTRCLDRLIRNRNRPRPEILKQAVNELARVRDDLFFITGITEPADQTGYYVLLDRIGAVKLNQISDSLAEVRQGMKQAYRFGRLARTYKYAMAQRFAFLFQRIGLPNDHTQRHSETLGRMTTNDTSNSDEVV